MSTSNFNFLNIEFPFIYTLGESAEKLCFIDAPSSLMKVRVMAEKMALQIGDEYFIENFENVSQNDRIKELKKQGCIPSSVADLMHDLRQLGNKAAHDAKGNTQDAIGALYKIFRISKYFYETLSIKRDDIVDLKFHKPIDTQDQNVEKNSAIIKQIEENEIKIKELEEQARINRLKTLKLTKESEEAKKHLELLKAHSKKASAKIELTEEETRSIIDNQLNLAGWLTDTQTINYKKNHTLPVKGKSMAIAEWPCGKGWADYALFHGKRLLGLVEAKPFAKNVMSDIEQAKQYARNIEEMTDIEIPNEYINKQYKVPFLFSSNGREYLEQMKEYSGIWFWDTRHRTNHSRPIMGWFSPHDLNEKLHFDEIEGAKKLQNSAYDFLEEAGGLNLRPYQIEAIQKIEHKITENLVDRRSLLAMATGTGKTRTMIGMCYRLIKSNRFKRILFLVDRTMLGDQAADNFTEVNVENLNTFSQIYNLKKLKDKSADLDTAIQFATVQSMIHRIENDQDAPSVGAYDCIVVDEAHRGYTLDKMMDDEEMILYDQNEFQSQYRKVLDYFDAYRIGITATPATHTANIFGDPVYVYSYRRAVVEGYLIDFEPPLVFQTKLSEGGITWKKGDEVRIYDPEIGEIIEDGIAEDEIKIDIKGFNKRVYNDPFNRAILDELITNPEYAIHPDNPGKTLIFATTDAHADQIVRILKEQFDAMGETVDEDAIKKITGTVKDRSNLLTRFKTEQYPNIVVTVDLLTTGIDVPKICNLIFLRRVNSRILYDQMMGRATRQCPAINKEVFRVFDAVGVTEIMMKEKVMKPVAPLVTKNFHDLVQEATLAKDPSVTEAKVERIIAKMQRTFHKLNHQEKETFESITSFETPSELNNQWKTLTPEQQVAEMQKLDYLWSFLDIKRKTRTRGILFSDHEDELFEVERVYSETVKPKDYLDHFAKFISEQRNKKAALELVVTRPQSLTRKALNEIRLLLDENGFRKTELNIAHKECTNEVIAADVISHIRRAAIGTDLISHNDRITNAMEKVRNSHKWNTVQLRWLSNIEKQLIKETIVTLEDLSKPPFSSEGGRKRFDKIFNNKTEIIFDEINEYLYA